MKKSILLLTLLTSFASCGGITGTKNLPESVRLVIQKAENGDAKAQNTAGSIYKYGFDIDTSKNSTLDTLTIDDIIIVERDLEKAYEWYKKAAEQGHRGAQHSLAAFYMYGQGGVEKDLDKAIYWYKKAADQGDVLAKYKYEDAIKNLND